MAERVKGHDETPALITDHAFEPRGAWYELCKHCGFAQAAHLTTTIDSGEEIAKEHIARYGEVRHAVPARKGELNRQYSYLFDREKELARLSSGGRARIGYVSDDDMEDE